MRYKVKFEMFDMKTFEISPKSVEYYVSHLIPDEVVDILFSTEPFTANLYVVADIHLDYCELNLMARGYSGDPEEDNFSREREILKKHFTGIDHFDVPIKQHPLDYTDAISLNVNLDCYFNLNAREEIESAIAAEFGYSYKYTSHRRAEVGASEESNWLKMLTEGVKTFIDVFNIFLFLKSIFEKYGPKDLPTQDLSESELDSQYKIYKNDKYLVAVSRDINIPLDKLNVKFKSISIDGTYMLVETEIGTYSVQFNNNHQIIMLNKLDD